MIFPACATAAKIIVDALFSISIVAMQFYADNDGFVLFSHHHNNLQNNSY